jgi:hypothetical protein
MSPDIDLYVIGLYVQQMVIINEIQNSSLGAKASRQSDFKPSQCDDNRQRQNK